MCVKTIATQSRRLVCRLHSKFEVTISHVASFLIAVSLTPLRFGDK